MADLFISEYAQAGVDSLSRTTFCPQEPANAEQAVAIGGTSAQSAAFNALTRFVVIHAEAACAIAFGTNPTAVATAKRMATGETRAFAVPVGAAYKVAVIQDS